MLDRRKILLLVAIILIPYIGLHGRATPTTIIGLEASSSFEWSLNIGLNDTFTLALIRNGTTYYIVAGNGTHIAMVNGSGYLEFLVDLDTLINVSEHGQYGFGYLGSNVSHAIVSIAHIEPGISSNGGITDIVYYHMVFIDPSGVTVTKGYKVITYVSMDGWRNYLVRPTPSDSYVSGHMTPFIAGLFGNVTKKMYPLTFLVGDEVKMFMVDGDGCAVDMEVFPMAMSYTSGDILGYMNGSEIVIILHNQTGGDFVQIYTLCENSDEIYNDRQDNVFLLNISVGGEVPDIVASDIDMDGSIEVIVENGSETAITGATADTENTSMLYREFGVATGIVDRLVVANFTGDAAPELIFYDPLSSEVEVWNTSKRLYSMKTDTPPVHDIVVCELDRDGYADVFFLTNTMAYFLYGQGQVFNISLSATPTSNGLIADIDTDGYLEMIYVANDTMYCYQTSFDGIGNLQFMNPDSPRVLAIDGDIDGDGISNAEELYVYDTDVYGYDKDIGSAENISTESQQDYLDSGITNMSSENGTEGWVVSSKNDSTMSEISTRGGRPEISRFTDPCILMLFMAVIIEIVLSKRERKESPLQRPYSYIRKPIVYQR